jgi:hypothetical protein
MLTSVDIEAIKKLTEEAINNASLPFYKQPDFYIGSLLGLVGITFSILSFKEAKKAKEAAAKAAQSVKRQSMVIEVLEISRICVLEPNMSYVEASNNFNQVISRIKYVAGFYQDDTSADLKQILKEIETSLDKIRVTLNDSNPVLMPQQTNIPNQIYYSIEPLFSNVVGNLGILKGILEKKLIHN